MICRYFDKNKYVGRDLEDLHHRVTLASQVVAQNLFFHQANPGDAGSEDNLVTLAKSCYVLVAAVEAVLERVPDTERAEALMEVQGYVEPASVDDAVEALRALAKMLFEG